MLVPLLLNNVLAPANASLAADHGTYDLVGRALLLLKGYRISAGAGAYAITGNANFIYTPVGRYILSANGGGFTLTGTAASSEQTWRLTASIGAYALSGSSVILSHTQQGSASNLRKTSTVSLIYPYTTELV